MSRKQAVQQSDEPSKHPLLTINGRPQPVPENSETIERRIRLFFECVRRLNDDPSAQDGASGELLINGMENLVAKIRPLFAREQSLIRWVALRGAMAILKMRSAEAPPEDLAMVMGLMMGLDSAGRPFIKVLRDFNPVADEQANAAISMWAMVTRYLADYDRIADMTMDDINADPQYLALSDDIALDCIVWSAVALLRLGLVQQLASKVPEPDAMPGPGWYIDPLFARSNRYWDGSDWTPKVRMADGREGIVSLR